MSISLSEMRFRFKELFSGSILFRTGVVGLLLILVLIFILAFISVKRNASIVSGTHYADSPFRMELQKYDTALSMYEVKEAEKILQRLEKRARSAEEWLSILKRWRSLVRDNSQYLPSYKTALNKALKAFPYSEAAAAVAVEAAFLYGDAKDPYFVTPENYAAAAAKISNPEQERFTALGLCFHVLKGDFEDPLKAALVPEIETMLLADLTRIPPNEKKNLQVDHILIRILKGSEQGTSLMINNLIAEDPQNRDLLRLGAEYFYDNGSSLISAALFARLGDFTSLAMEADALALSSDLPAARNIWIALASPSEEPHMSIQRFSKDIVMRSLYNLAASSSGEAEARFWLERLQASRDIYDENAPFVLSQAEIFGLIRYTRFDDTARSIERLEDNDNPLLDLELLRRKFEITPSELWTPQVWYLLGRHPEDENLYRWAAAFFDRQRLYIESAQLLKLAQQQKFSGGWLDLHLGLAMFREGRIDEGEKLLKEALSKNDMPAWIIYANLGRLSESRRSISTALDYYESAAALAGSTSASVLLQLRLSRCYDTLGRFADSRSALEQALKMDPDNVNVRFELNRINAK